jgi:hypothetical protein
MGNRAWPASGALSAIRPHQVDCCTSANPLKRLPVIGAAPVANRLGKLWTMNRNRHRAVSFDSFETLEPRQLLSGGSFPLGVSLQKTKAGFDLLITGTKKADRIGITQDERGIVIRDGTASKLIKAKLHQIIVNGGEGNDLIGVDSSIKIRAALNGGSGHDVIVGGGGNDAINGGAGNDSVYGGGGNDTVVGAAGNDSLYGNTGNDSLVGGAGDDVLVTVGGGRYDTLEGDAGFDSFWTDASSREVVTDKLSADETYNGAWHQVDGFMPYFDKDGDLTEIPIEPEGDDLLDPELDFKEDGTYTADGYEDYSDNPLFPKAGPSMDDIKQGVLGRLLLPLDAGGRRRSEPRLDSPERRGSWRSNVRCPLHERGRRRELRARGCGAAGPRGGRQRRFQSSGARIRWIGRG